MNDIFIDEIAREMTEVEAPAGLRARVLEDIRRPQHSGWSRTIAPAAAAAAIAALGFASLRPVLLPAELPAFSRAGVEAFVPGVPSPRIAAVSSARGTTPDTFEISTDELAWQSRRFPRLEVRTPVVEPIQPVTTSIAPITVEPITLEPISVPRSGSGDWR